MQLAHLGIYKSMYLARQTPDASDVQITYGALLDLGKEISHALEPNAKIGNDRRGAIVGVASELGIMQLLYRFIIKTDSHEWAVMPSLLSEDHSTGTHQSDLREGWDVGVYEQYSASDQPSLLFKAQVKSSKKRAEELRYAPGIAVIYALHDLCTTGEYMLHPSTISDECFYETFSSDMESVVEVTKKLDQREQLLLDILG